MLALLAAALLTPAWAGDARPPARDGGFRAAVFEGRYLEALRLYDALGAKSGRAAYFAGWTNLRLNRPEAAVPQLERAQEAGFAGPAGWKPTAELLARAQAQMAALPPAVQVPGLDETRLKTYADARDGLSGDILAAQTQYLKVGRGIFGDTLPALRVYLFKTHEAMDRLAVAAGDRRTGRRGSTGGCGFVRLSAQDLTRPDEDDSLRLALHETTHGWMATYLRERWDRNVVIPAYMDEGLAEYVGGLWKYDERRERLRAARLRRIARWRARNGAAPPLSALKTTESFHLPERDMLDYDLSALLMERLLGPAGTGAARIPAVLDALARANGDDAAAWKEATGKDVGAEYAALAREL